MKKLYFLGLLFFCFIIPVNIHAIKIDKVSIKGNHEMKPKEDITLDFNVNFKEVESGLDKTLGIWYVNFELLYDRDLLEITGASSKEFDISILEENGTNKIYIFGEVIDKEDDSNYCADGMLYCSSNYTVSVKFHMKNNKKDITSVRMSSIETGLLDMVEAREYTEKDAMLIITPDVAVHDITIKQEKPKTSNTNKNTNTNTVSRYLKSLEIEEGNIEFKKDVTDYVIYVDKDINQLNVKATTEDSKAKVEIIGADDLKKSNHQVKVVVIATDKTKKTYYIKVKEKQKDVEKVEKPLKKKKKEKNNIDSDSLKKWAGIGVIVLLVIGIIYFIISKIRDHSIDKKLSKLDDD